MPDIDKKGALDRLQRKLQELIDSSNAAPSISDALRDVVAAIDHADDTLIKSSVNSLLVCLADVARNIIRYELEKSQATKESIREVWRELVDGLVCEDFDEIKNVVESIIEESISRMVSTKHRLVVVLEKHDHPVENAHQLEEGIRDLRQFRDSILKDWPSSTRSPSPINRETLAEARKAFAAGYKGLTKHDMVWGKEAPEKGQ